MPVLAVSPHTTWTGSVVCVHTSLSVSHHMAAPDSLPTESSKIQLAEEFHQIPETSLSVVRPEYGLGTAFTGSKAVR